MKIYFAHNRKFHRNEINSTVNIFEGSPLTQRDFYFSISNNNYIVHEGCVG